MVPLLQSKLFVPPSGPALVPRQRLIDMLNHGLHRKLTLISAPAGFGKTTLVSAWLAGSERPAAWLSLDADDNDPARFLAYLVAALQTVAATVGAGVLGALHTPQPPPPISLLTALLNEITTTVPTNFILVLDDYHVIEAQPVEQALTFLLEHLPPQMRLVIATREDPPLPLARLRARGQLTELRAADLRFTATEAAEFLNPVGLNLSAADIAALEARTEGWVAGLQLAALSMQGHPDPAAFIQSFTGSHHFVLDYLVEEVLHQQPEQVQSFLLQTSILERLCGPLCDAVLLDPSATGQATLFALQQANLFIVPLDNERRWYRYHHLFAELLRQRLQQSATAPAQSGGPDVAELHRRASQWYEDNDLGIEAFHHAVAANDIARAEHLIEGDQIPRHHWGAVTAILKWLDSLPKSLLDARPWLWWRYAALMLVVGQTTGVAEKLDAAEAALPATEPDEKTRNLIGEIATARAVLALTRYQVETMLAQSHRALEYLHPQNLSMRTSVYWTLGMAYLFQGNRVAAREHLTKAIALGQASGDTFTSILATIGLGQVQEAENQLHLAAETFQHVLRLAGDQPLQIVYEAHLGLARILYEWNDLARAEQQALQSLQLARQYDRVIDRFVTCEVFLARLKLAQGDVVGAAALLAQTHQAARQQNFVHRLPEVAAVQVLTLLRQGHLTAAAQLAETHQLPLSQARVHLAQGHPAAALALLAGWRQQVEAKGWQDEQLKVLILQAVAHQAAGAKPQALDLLGEALALAELGGFLRLFLDEGPPMMSLLSAALERGMLPDAIGRLLAAFAAEPQPGAVKTPQPPAHQPLIEPLSQREREVLQLMAQGLSNQEISERLFLALSTVKGHNRNIFDKLQVQRRTEAIARARELGLL